MHFRDWILANARKYRISRFQLAFDLRFVFIGRSTTTEISRLWFLRKRTTEIESCSASPNNPDSCGCNRACLFLARKISKQRVSFVIPVALETSTEALKPLNWPARCVKLTPRNPTAVSAKTFLYRATWRCHRCRAQRMKSVAEIMVLQVCRTFRFVSYKPLPQQFFHFVVIAIGGCPRSLKRASDCYKSPADPRYQTSCALSLSLCSFCMGYSC